MKFTEEELEVGRDEYIKMCGTLKTFSGAGIGDNKIHALLLDKSEIDQLPKTVNGIEIEYVVVGVITAQKV